MSLHDDITGASGLWSARIGVPGCAGTRRGPVSFGGCGRSSRVRMVVSDFRHQAAHPLAARQPAHRPRHRRHRRLRRRGSRPRRRQKARQQARQRAGRPRPRARPRRRGRQPDPDHPRPARRPPLP